MSDDLRERIALAIEALAVEVRGDIAVYDELAIARAEVLYRAARIARETPLVGPYTTPEPEGLDQAIDRLEEVGLADVRDYIRAMKARHDRAILLLEDLVRDWMRHSTGPTLPDPRVTLIAEARGETTEQTQARLGPASSPESGGPQEITPEEYRRARQEQARHGDRFPYRGIPRMGL